MAVKVTYDDSRAIEYIRERLSKGRALSRELARLPLERGRVTAYIPAGSSSPPSKAFERSIGVEWSATAPALIGFISRFLEYSSLHVALFEDNLGKPGDAFLESEKVPYILIGSTICYFPKSSRHSDISDAIWGAKGWLTVGMLSRLPAGVTLEQRGSLAEIALETTIERTAYILVGAHDEEVTLIWTPPAS